MAYIQPQLQIFQEFSQLPQNVVANLNALIVGPHYKLFRYSEASEKQFTALGEYAAGTYNYPGQPFGSVVDTDYVKLFLENVLARYASFVGSAALTSLKVTGDGNNQITAVAGTQDLVFAAGNGVSASQLFRTRGVKAGDTIRYVTDDEEEGLTRVAGFVADTVPAVVDDTVADTANAASAATDLTSEIALVAAAGNVSEYNAAGAGVYAMPGTGGEYTGVYASGILSEKFEIEITSGGLPGVARATVRSLTSGYVRTNVPVEDVETGEAAVYLGRNVFMRLVADEYASELTFQAGDRYTAEDAVAALFTEVSPTAQIDVDGEYVGVRDTTYTMHVVRGGVFTRTVNTIEGFNSAAADAAVLEGAVENFNTDWFAGDVDDEYVIRCTKDGDISEALFSVSSLRGDNDSGISFQSGVPRAVGTSGLQVTLTHAGNFERGDFWVVRVNGTRPRVQVTDARGADQGTFAVVGAGTVFNLGGNGLTASFTANGNSEGGFAPGGGLVAGDKFYVKAHAASAGAYRTLVTEDALPEGADIALLDFHLPRASVEISANKLQSPGAYNWVATTDAVQVSAGIAIQDTSWTEYDGTVPYIPVVAADMFVQYRALLQDYVGSLFSFDTAAQVAAELGTIHPDNPLAQGVHSALLNSGGRAVYFSGVRSDDLAGYSEILELAEKVDTVYSVVALSEDRTVVDAVAGHVNAMSAEDVKRWRIGWCSSALPETTELMTADLNGGDEWLATATGAGNRTIDIANENSDLLAVARVGDYVRLEFATDAWGGVTWETRRIESIVSSSRLILDVGASSQISDPSKVEIFRRNRASEIATRVAATATSFGSRRMYYVAPMDIHVGGVVTRPVFAAAALAGLVSSMAPQRPLTNVTLSGFSEIPAAYRVFNRADLNAMAAGGTFILAQDTENGPIYVRHQLSTAASDGNLLTSELSVVKNLDAISYYFSDVLSPYIGRYNITPELINVINIDLIAGLGFMQSPFTGAGLLGPMVLDTDRTAVRRVEQHPTLKDHVVAVVDLELPLPVNVIQLRLVV